MEVWSIVNAQNLESSINIEIKQCHLSLVRKVTAFLIINKESVGKSRNL